MLEIPAEPKKYNLVSSERNNETYIHWSGEISAADLMMGLAKEFPNVPLGQIKIYGLADCSIVVKVRRQKI